VGRGRVVVRSGNSDGSNASADCNNGTHRQASDSRGSEEAAAGGSTSCASSASRAGGTSGTSGARSGRGVSCASVGGCRGLGRLCEHLGRQEAQDCGRYEKLFHFQILIVRLTDDQMICLMQMLHFDYSNEILFHLEKSISS
jgi:hypothetical protein